MKKNIIFAAMAAVALTFTACIGSLAGYEEYLVVLEVLSSL